MVMLSRTNDAGKDGNDESTGFSDSLSKSFECFSRLGCGVDPARLSMASELSSVDGLSFPCFFSQPKIGGSSPPAQLTSTLSKPRSFLPLAPTAAKALPICLNGTRAVPYLGGFVGAFLGGLSESTIDDVSTSPNWVKRVAMAEVVVSSGRD